MLPGASTAELKRTAIGSGMATLRRSGINKIAEGVTTVEEVLRDHDGGLSGTIRDAPPVDANAGGGEIARRAPHVPPRMSLAPCE